METAQEQAHYGGRCIHGTATGTPGGADLMCQLCELGYFDWIEVPRYSLMLNDRPFANLSWTEPELRAGPRVCTLVTNIFTNVSMDLGVWSVNQTADGYWN